MDGTGHGPQSIWGPPQLRPNWAVQSHTEHEVVQGLYDGPPVFSEQLKKWGPLFLSENPVFQIPPIFWDPDLRLISVR